MSMTDEEIVAGLRSRDAETRQEALETLLPGNKGAVLLQVGALQTTITTSKRCDPAASFAAVLYIAQQFGKHLGLQLTWVPNPDDANIEIAPGKILR